MVEVHSKALKTTVNISRFIGKIENQTGPTVVFYAGIHGNEPAGIFALKQAFDTISPNQVNGSIYAISGNLSALRKSQRFIKQDLNRIWSEENLKALENKTVLSDEEHEQFELYEILKTILNKNSPPYYFIDLHTTSSETLPFITINDALINRKFADQYPVPIVLGIEEHLDGPLLSYINGKGYVSVGFESGQHDNENAISNALAFVYLTLGLTASINKDEFPEIDTHYEQLKRYARKLNDVFEIIHLHRLQNGDSFKMYPDFESFQNIKKGTLLAEANGEILKATYSARIFMPLYQKKGKEGYFIIRKIHPFFLKLSEILRKRKADGLLVVLPGVSWQDKSNGTLKVNLKIARFLAKQIFHLLGFRSKKTDATHLKLNNRERVTKIEMYQDLPWYSKSSAKNKAN
ncbi:MAG: aspartoacylase [Flavobacteriaceae bacterium]|nr:succinylglutamate desuccinylase/aspartoacylase family protein [Bacteroidia bacterium]MBT8286607.1 succinylglutamate desuccinylase/aspartoacylase family protein [Bacteroidia bacterium]NNF75132.1 aspartoacylase [Flavobacteriaceae bacterium]NNK72148.1 aspartoacylase [Flavobacteriaceae bacterium]